MTLSEQNGLSGAGLSERFRSYGEVMVDAIPQSHQARNLFVTPQCWEGIGLTPLEELLCSVSVLATRVGACEELKSEGETRRLIPQYNTIVFTQTGRLS